MCSDYVKITPKMYKHFGALLDTTREEGVKMTVTLCFDVEGGLRIEGDTLAFKDAIKRCGYSWFPRAKVWGVPNTRGREKPSRNVEREQKRLSDALGVAVETRIILPQDKNEAIESRIKMLESKQEYKEERAKIIGERSDALSQKAFDLTQMIPLGQPILVGHHSERKHRNHIEKVHDTMRKSVELCKLAEQSLDSARANEREMEELKLQLATPTKKRWENIKALVSILKKCKVIKSMRQNYKGTGSKAKIQYFLRLANGESEELWIDHREQLHVSFGGVLRTKLFRVEFESNDIGEIGNFCIKALEKAYLFEVSL